MINWMYQKQAISEPKPAPKSDTSWMIEELSGIALLSYRFFSTCPDDEQENYYCNGVHGFMLSFVVKL